MNKLTLALIGLSFATFSCGEQKTNEMTPEESQKLETEIESIESEANKIDEIKKEIDASAKELDDALNDL